MFPKTFDPHETIRLISSHQPALLAYILILHPNHNDAQDILQETNVVLWQKMDDFQPGSNFKAWSFRVAYLQTLAFFGRKKRGNMLGLSPELLATIANQTTPMMDDFEERHRALRKCLDKLPEDDRMILLSHYQSDKPLAELSEQVGRSVGALKQVLSRIRRALRRCVELQLT